MRLIFLLEEKSTKELLDVLLKKILPPEVDFLTIPHEGKADLRKSIPVKLASFRSPDDRFVIIQDQDSNDCRVLKEDLKRLCCAAGKEDVLIRIACHEMEAWYFGDLQAVSDAYGKDLTKLANKKLYRDPDSIVSPKNELRKLLPEHQQISGAKKIAPLMDIDINKSTSLICLSKD